MKINKKILQIAIISIIIFTIIGCKESAGYKVMILDVENYNETKLGDWIKSCNQEDGYYEFINSDADSWEMYIYIRNYNNELRYISYNASIDIIDGTIEIKINSEDANEDDQVMNDILVYITAPLRGPWPSLSEVFIDDKQFDLVKRDIIF